jgi:metal-sulfur cluster biosynthetic enzyme
VSEARDNDVTMAQREAEIRLALGRVDDPELDEAVTDLRFIESVAIDAAGAVSIGFRLPTYWCAANFAFLMADDMRREVAALPWVTRVAVTLGDHMYADKINTGLAEGKSFPEAFGADAAGDLVELRRTFQIKAFQRRQEALLRHLLADGHSPAALAEMPLTSLQNLTLTDTGQRLRRRYLDRRHVCASPAEPRAFVDTDGKALRPAELETYLQALSRVGINAEFNGVLCRGLLAARFNEPVCEPESQPSLRHFVAQAAQNTRATLRSAT